MIPSLLQIPSAVSDSKLHSVLPNNGKGDFQFDRSTGATRINKDGLIEEVGYFSSELVQNGNFSELGSELVTNGTFNTDSNWTKGGGWIISDGKAQRSAQSGSTSIYQNISFVAGKTYKIQYDLDISAGEFNLRISGGTLIATTGRTTSGTYAEYIVANSGNNVLNLRANNAAFVGSVDNVSVKQVDPNDRWVLNPDWSFTNNGVSITNATGGYTDSALYQIITLDTSKTYKVNINVSSISGSIQVYTGSFAAGFSISTTGEKSFTLDLTSLGNRVNIVPNASTSAVITSFSIVEVQGDRPRLSYDITNGVVEDKPHLLLEPSSTNSITFSNDLSQSVWSGSNINNSVYGQVGVNGTNNAWLFTKTGASNSDFYNTAFTGTYTFSFFVKKEANKGVKIYNFGDTVQQSTINIETGAYVAGVNTVTIQEFPNDWLRVAQTLTISNGKYYLYVSNGTETQIASSIVVQYFQIEQQAFPTTYIPTAGTTITRAAETCNNSKPSVNSTEGVLYCEIAALANDGTSRKLAISDGTNQNCVVLNFTTVTNQLRAFLFNGVLTVNVYNALSNALEHNKIAFVFKANDFSLYVNGSKVATDTSGTTFSAGTLTEFNFNDGGVSAPFYGKVKGLAVYNEALSESQLMQLTGVTASSIYSNFVTRTASFTVEALNEVKKVIDNL